MLFASASGRRYRQMVVTSTLAVIAAPRFLLKCMTFIDLHSSRLLLGDREVHILSGMPHRTHTPLKRSACEHSIVNNRILVALCRHEDVVRPF